VGKEIHSVDVPSAEQWQAEAAVTSAVSAVQPGIDAAAVAAGTAVTAQPEEEAAG